MIILLTVAGGCSKFKSQETLAYEDAVREKTVTVLEKFRSNYPNSSHLPGINGMLDELRTKVSQLHSDSFREMCDKNFDRASKLLQQILRSAPDDPIALNNLGVIACRNGDFDRAQKLLEQARTSGRVKDLLLFVAYNKPQPRNDEDKVGLLGAILPDYADVAGITPQKSNAKKYIFLGGGDCRLVTLSEYYPGSSGSFQVENNLRALRERSGIVPVIGATLTGKDGGSGVLLPPADKIEWRKK